MELLLDLLERCEKLDIRGWYRAKEELAALRKAGEKMARILKFIQLENDSAHLESAGLWSVNGETEIQVSEAREAWEAANK